MTERIGAIMLLIVSVVAVVVLGNDIVYDVGLIKVALYTVGMLGVCGGIYTIIRL